MTLFEPVFEEEEWPVWFISPGAAYFHKSDKAWVTLVFDEFEEYGALSVELDCIGPHPKHWLGWEIDGTGLSYLIGTEEVDVVQWMMEEGLCPGQRFVVELEYYCSRDYWGEYDSSVSLRIMNKEPIENEEALKRWIEFFRQQKLWDELYKDIEASEAKSP